MKNLGKKIKLNLLALNEIVQRGVKLDFRFGIYSFYVYFLMKLHRDSEPVYGKKHKMILSFLRNLCNDILEKYKDMPIYSKDENTEMSEYDGSIWVFWDDMTNVPPIVKRCLKQMRKYAGNRKVILINKENITDYIDIPKIIADKYRLGIVSRTHYSDVVRISVMLKYGGIYMDSTILQTAPWLDKWSNCDFLTFKLEIDEPYKVVSRGNWCVFCFACHKNNLLMRMTLEMMVRYWEHYNFLIDYLWIDYFWMLSKLSNPHVRKMLDDVPYSNPNLFALESIKAITPRTPYTVCEYLQMLHDDTSFYKFSYKGTIGVPERNEDGNLTLLGRIIETDI